MSPVLYTCAVQYLLCDGLALRMVCYFCFCRLFLNKFFFTEQWNKWPEQWNFERPNQKFEAFCFPNILFNYWNSEKKLNLNVIGTLHFLTKDLHTGMFNFLLQNLPYYSTMYYLEYFYKEWHDEFFILLFIGATKYKTFQISVKEFYWS